MVMLMKLAMATVAAASTATALTATALTATAPVATIPLTLDSDQKDDFQLWEVHIKKNPMKC